MTVVPRYVIKRVPVADTYPLRALVLRNGGPLESARVPGDDHPEVATYAALDSAGSVIGCVGLFPEACPDFPDDRRRGWRIRGMATSSEWRGRGVGTAVLAAALDHVRRAGGGLVWCNARTPARTLYERAGFRVRGEEWEDPEIGPHVRMWRAVLPTGGSTALDADDAAPIGWIREIVLNSRDPRALAAFWSALLGGEPVEWYDGWVTLEPPPHGQRLSFQRTDQPPASDAPVHFDVLVEDLEAAHGRVVAAGAVHVEERWSPRPDEHGGAVRWRVYRDPAGHAFCLVVR